MIERYDDKLPDLGKPAAPRDYSESKLHFAVVNYLRGEIKNGRHVLKLQKPFDVLWMHPCNEFVDEKSAFWAKMKGILPGASDLLFWWQGGFGAVELKRLAGGSQSPNQRTFQYNFEHVGGKYTVCRKVSEVRDALKSWGLICKNEQCIEPALSHTELLAMQREIYKR